MYWACSGQIIFLLDWNTSLQYNGKNQTTISSQEK